MANEKVFIVSGANNFFHETASVGSGVSYMSVGNDSGNTTKGSLRFTGIDVAQGVTIEHASIYLYQQAEGAGSGNLKFITKGIDEDNTGDFSGTNPFGRSQTTASDSADNPLPGNGNYKQITVTSIVQEILDRGGWSSGNAMGFNLEDNSSPNDVYIYDDYLFEADSYLIIRVSAEPDFTPTPISVSAPAIPALDDWGIKISKPGVSVLEATEEETFFTTRKKQFKIVEQGEITTSGVPHSISHSQGEVPFAEAFVKLGSYWFRLPQMNFSGGANVGYMLVDNNSLDFYVANGSKVYYYIFIDELDT